MKTRFVLFIFASVIAVGCASSDSYGPRHYTAPPQAATVAVVVSDGKPQTAEPAPAQTVRGPARTRTRIGTPEAYGPQAYPVAAPVPQYNPPMVPGGDGMLYPESYFTPQVYPSSYPYGSYGGGYYGGYVPPYSSKGSISWSHKSAGSFQGGSYRSFRWDRYPPVRRYRLKTYDTSVQVGVAGSLQGGLQHELLPTGPQW